MFMSRHTMGKLGSQVHTLSHMPNAWWRVNVQRKTEQEMSSKAANKIQFIQIFLILTDTKQIQFTQRMRDFSEVLIVSSSTLHIPLNLDEYTCCWSWSLISTRANNVTAPQGQEGEVETFFKGKFRQASCFYTNYQLQSECSVKFGWNLFVTSSAHSFF